MVVKEDEDGDGGKTNTKIVVRSSVGRVSRGEEEGLNWKSDLVE